MTLSRSTPRLGLAFAFIALAGCGGTPTPQPQPAVDPRMDARVGLKAGLRDAGEVATGMKVVAKAVSPPGFDGITNSDLAFVGNYAVQGNYNGPVIWDIRDPANPVLVTAYTCPASQNDVSVYRNLMFMSAEAYNGRVDCKPGNGNPTGPDSVSKERMRGVRVFDISDIKNPKLVANVQTCRGSHTHTVLEDPKDKENIYIYVSGSAPVRSPNELAGCYSQTPQQDANSSLMRIEIIKVPLANPERSAVASRANIFAGLKAPAAHGPASEDLANQQKAIATAKATGGFVAMNPASKQEMVLGAGFVRPQLDSIVKARGGTGNPTAADTAVLRTNLQGIIDRIFAGQAPQTPATPGVSENSPFRQCHDITVYPRLGLAGGACEGHGILLDISDPLNPVRLDAAADSNFAYWHSATFNNDGTKLLFSDEWGGGGSPKCRAGDKPEWGANAIFTIENRKLKFQSYYKIPTIQTPAENCVAHNGSLIPIPGRDVMVQAWYQGGISVFDWSDPAKPFEVAYFDRGPVDSTQMRMGGSWSVYWYNGSIVSSEIARGMDVADLTPTQFISQNEIDAAKTVKWTHLNAQGQPLIEWPPSFSLAKAFVDQLERNKCLSTQRIGQVRSALASAERAPGAQRTSALTTLASQIQGDVGSSCDGKRVQMLLKAVNDLKSMTVS
ncbi:MAG: hypothetical protein H7066_08685 [Cytophagaceae bacterium]|nr:hypothetical protein [Gemmatimonadaceae bacterium]